MSDFDDFKDDDANQEGGGGFLKYCLICGCLVGLMLLLLGGASVWWVKGMIIMDAAKVEQNLKGTIDCEIPEGYHGLFGMNMMGIRMSTISPNSISMQGGGAQGQNQPLMFMVFQMPPGQSRAQAKQQMQQQMQAQGAGGNMTIDSQETIKLTVRGQEVEAERMIGTSRGQKVRQIFTTIDKSSTDKTPIFIMFMGVDDGFDQTAMDFFLNSIK